MNKKKLLFFSGFIIIILVFIFIVYKNSYKNEIYTDKNDENVKNNEKINKIPGMVSLMLETKYKSGQYKASTDNKLPTSGYEFNESLSNCENGGKLTWNEDRGTVTVKTNKSDRCYVYFDLLPPDVYLNISNRPTTYGKFGSINCTGSSATYNQQYNRIEISSFNSKYSSCSLNYTDSTSKVNLASYITGLAGTTQGTGQVVNETATIDKSSFTAGAKLEQSGYSVSRNDATYPFEWDNTNKTWTSTNHTDYDTATFIFNVATAGNYQVCYKQSSEQNYDYTIFYKDNTPIKSLEGISNSDFECYYLGNLTTSNDIVVTYQKDGSGSDGSDNVVFYLQSGTSNENIQNFTDTRYEGKNPNNYIWFNNEYWRIIGVFDSASHGVSGQNLVKIIRADVLDVLAWHKSETNDWTASSLKSLLNGAYYNAQDGTSSGYCYVEGTTVVANCDYTKRGIQSGYRGMIANVTWYLGGHSSGDATAEAFYGYERGTTVYSGRPTSTTGYIGLMYASDYGYSVLSSSCARTTNLSSYDNATCAGQSWLYGKGTEWTLTPDSWNRNRVFPLADSGLVFDSSTFLGYGSRPVLYLDASVYKIDGDGSLDNPYIVGM